MKARYWVGIKKPMGVLKDQLAEEQIYPDNEWGVSKREVKALKEQLLIMKPHLKSSELVIIGVFEEN